MLGTRDEARPHGRAQLIGLLKAQRAAFRFRQFIDIKEAPRPTPNGDIGTAEPMMPKRAWASLRKSLGWQLSDSTGWAVPASSRDALRRQAGLLGLLLTFISAS